MPPSGGVLSSRRYRRLGLRLALPASARPRSRAQRRARRGPPRAMLDRQLRLAAAPQASAMGHPAVYARQSASSVLTRQSRRTSAQVRSTASAPEARTSSWRPGDRKVLPPISHPPSQPQARPSDAVAASRAAARKHRRRRAGRSGINSAAGANRPGASRKHANPMASPPPPRTSADHRRAALAIRRILPPNPTFRRQPQAWPRPQEPAHRDCRRVPGGRALHRPVSVGALPADAQGGHHQGA